MWRGMSHRRTILAPIAVLAASSLLAACVSTGGQVVVGAGARPVSEGGGAGVAGEGIAGEAIAPLSKEDRRRALAAEFQALEFQPVGDPVEWRGRTGSGAVEALAPFQVGSQNCRRLVHRLVVDGENVIARGSACREPNGTWTPIT